MSTRRAPMVGHDVGMQRPPCLRTRSTTLDGKYVSTVSESGSDTGCIHCIWNLSARKQPVLYLLYLEQSWIQSGYSVSVDHYLCISHLGSQQTLRDYTSGVRTCVEGLAVSQCQSVSVSVSQSVSQSTSLEPRHQNVVSWLFTLACGDSSGVSGAPAVRGPKRLG